MSGITGSTENHSSGSRILFVLNNLELGGAEKQALMLAEHLKNQQGFIVQVVAFMPGARVAQLCSELDLQCEVIPFEFTRRWKRLLPRLLKLAARIRRLKPDLILPYILVPNIACSLVWRLTGAKGVVWQQRDDGLGLREDLIERLAVLLCPHFVSNSEHAARMLERRYKLKTGSVCVVRNGTKLAKPQADWNGWRAKLQADEQCLVACMVSNIHGLKDHATLIRAWPAVTRAMRSRGKRTLLVLAGRLDEGSEELRSLASQLGVHNDIKFLGEVTDIPGLLAACDLSVYSSRSEGCPNAIVESMAAGLSVAATDTPGIREAVGPNAEFLASPGDSEALAATILKFLESDEFRKLQGLENRQRAERHFGVNRMVSEMSEVVRRALDARSVQSACERNGSQVRESNQIN